MTALGPRAVLPLVGIQLAAYREAQNEAAWTCLAARVNASRVAKGGLSTPVRDGAGGDAAKEFRAEAQLSV